MAIHEQTLVSKVHYPQDSLAVNNSATAGAGLQCQTSLAAVVNRTTYLTKAILTSGAPASLQEAYATITDGTWTCSVRFVETVTAGGFANLDFGDSPLVASGVNTAITVTIPTIASGAATAIIVVGYQR